MMALCLLLVHLDTNSTGTIPQAMPQVVVDDNGKANASYPIEVPPGTKDVQPNLSLVYHSDEPDGLLGSGWWGNYFRYTFRSRSFGNSFAINGLCGNTYCGDALYPSRSLG